MPTGEMTDPVSVEKRLAEGRELTKPFAPPPPPRPPITNKLSGPEEGPDKRRMRYLVRRALFAFEEANGLCPTLQNLLPDFAKTCRLVNLPNVHESIIVALRDKLAELHDQDAPLADIPEDDSEQLAMQYLGEIPGPSSVSKEAALLSAGDIGSLARRLDLVSGRNDYAETILKTLQGSAFPHQDTVGEIPATNPDRNAGGLDWLTKALRTLFGGRKQREA